LSGFEHRLAGAGFIFQTAIKSKNLLVALNVYSEANNFTGYKKPEPAKIASLVTCYIRRSKPDFNDKLKLNKLLFFTDFTHYKNYGSSVSGLSYRAIKYGPVPANYDNIYVYLENGQLIESKFLRLSNGGYCRIEPSGEGVERIGGQQVVDRLPGLCV